MDDPFYLERFLEAQAGVYYLVLSELAAGIKRSHWIWFIFPQLKGLGSSAMARRYGLESIDEARAYLAHEVLGARLAQCTELVIQSHAPSLRNLFGSPDDLKFRSSMTLFAHASHADSLYHAALNRWCDGVEDPRTVSLLGADDLNSSPP
jgi:uncharacterized protein (DUF1810 family)